MRPFPAAPKESDTKKRAKSPAFLYLLQGTAKGSALFEGKPTKALVELSHLTASI